MRRLTDSYINSYKVKEYFTNGKISSGIVYIDDNKNFTNMAIGKLGRLEDIEGELGIDLITLFKALKNGYYYKLRFHNIKTKKVEEIIRYTDYAYFYYDSESDTYNISNVDHDVCLNRYGEDWALTKEELL